MLIIDINEYKNQAVRAVAMIHLVQNDIIKLVPPEAKRS